MNVRIAGRGRLTATATMRDGQLTIRVGDQRDPEFWAEVDITPAQLATLEASDDNNVAEAVAADHECTFGPVEQSRFTGTVHRKCLECGLVSLDIDAEEAEADARDDMFCSELVIDADYGENSWEIVLRYDAESNEGAWSDMSDADLPAVVGPNIAALLIQERDTKAAAPASPSNAREAAMARIKGEWDNPHLLAFGPLSTDTLADVLAILEKK